MSTIVPKLIVLVLAGAVLKVQDALGMSLLLAILAGLVTWDAIPKLKATFLGAGLSGKDKLKKNEPKIPETMGLPAAIIYLIAMFIFIPFPFVEWFGGKARLVHEEHPAMMGTFPYHKLSEILAAILAIQSMVLLGFADDVLDVRWRYKIWFPALASIPLLIFYYTNFNATHVVMPLQLRPYLGELVDLGPLYYVYMVMLVIFCTHSINILAGINGIEAGQSLVIALSVIANDLFHLFDNTGRTSVETHLFSLYFMLPFASVTAALLWHNWYPANVFVGDTFCYFAGMTLAVVGILGHFSKTLMLFFMPQIFNFVYSCPQLFRLVKCPRHRMPSLITDTDLLEYSTMRLDKPANFIGRLALGILELVGLLHVVRRDKRGRILECNNLTLLNLVLAKTGPMNERHVTMAVLSIQALSSVLAFFIRYKLVQYVY